ncbi:MAG: hypothetical protein AAGG68_07915, partial [Bacteroidota bacterium]
IISLSPPKSLRAGRRAKKQSKISIHLASTVANSQQNSHFSHLHIVDYSRFNYFILLVIFAYLFFLFRVELEPTYDPFDDLLRVSVDRLYEDGCDYIFREHQSPALRYEEEYFYIDYGIDIYGEKWFVAERIFSFPIDTVSYTHYAHQDYPLRDSIPVSSAVLEKFSSQIERFHFEIDSIFHDEIRITSFSKKDTILLKKYIRRNYNFGEDSTMVRNYRYRIETSLNLEEKLWRYFDDYSVEH